MTVSPDCASAIISFLLTRPSRGVTCNSLRYSTLFEFLLTRPSRGVTWWLKNTGEVIPISTHTPLAGRDVYLRVRVAVTKQFLLTRPSRGVTKIFKIFIDAYVFLLTRPSRGVTKYGYQPTVDRMISTHTPLAGRDLQ